jgi:hypothetical protein
MGVREPHDRTGYFERVQRWARQRAGWVHLHENLPRDQLSALIASQRYGIHGKEDEHFGIGVAEMVRGGCVVFTPNDGGQVEIVGRDDRLTFGTVDEAATRILAVLASPTQQQSLRAHLAARAEAFGAPVFCARIRDLVRERTLLGLATAETD